MRFYRCMACIRIMCCKVSVAGQFMCNVLDDGDITVLCAVLMVECLLLYVYCIIMRLSMWCLGVVPYC